MRKHMKKTVCDKCDHGMLLHGNENGKGYCSEGNGDWCDCKVKGLSYDEEIYEIKKQDLYVVTDYNIIWP